MIYKSKISCFKYVTVLSLLLFFGALFFVNDKVMAADGWPDNVVPSTSWANQPWMAVTRPGSNGMNAGQQRAQVYVPIAGPTSSATFTMTIDDGCDTTVNDDNPFNNDTRFTIWPATNVFNVVGGITGPIGPDMWAIDCTSGGSVTFSATLPGVGYGLGACPPSGSTTGNLVCLNNNTQLYRSAAIAAGVTSPSTAYYVNRFRFSTGHPGALFAFTEQNTDPGTNQGLYTGIAYHNGGPNSWGWTTSVTFAQPCDAGIDTRDVYFFDTDDSNAAGSSSPFWQNNNQPIRWALSAFYRDSGVFEPGASGGGELKGGNNVQDYIRGFTFRSQYYYRLDIVNVNYVNSIQVALPFAQVDAYDRCVTPPPPTNWNYIHSSFSAGPATASSYPFVAPGTNIPVSNTILNNGNGTGQNYTHQIQRSVGGGAWTDINNTGNTGLGAGASRNRSGNYVIPAGLNDTVICFRGAITPFSGQSTPTATITSSGYRFTSTLCVRVQPRPPTCSASAMADIGAGVNFTSGVSVTNPNGTTALSITQLSYATTVESGAVLVGSNTSGNATGTIPFNLAAGGNVSRASGNINITSVGTYRITWTVTSAYGSTTCSNTVRTFVVPPICEVINVTTTTGQPFYATVRVTNPNAVPVSINPPANYSIPSGNPRQNGVGNAQPPHGSLPESLGSSPDFILIRSNTDTPIPNAGAYTITWTINWSVPSASGTAVNSSGGPCAGLVIVSDIPYAKFYGNDVFAGGGFTPAGGSCSASATALAQGNVEAVAGTPTLFRGAGAQLAVFAADAIRGFSPLAYQTVPAASQVATTTLAFSNLSGGSAASPPPDFGGDFGVEACAYDYYGNRGTNPALPSTDLSGLDGAYDVDGPVALNTGTGVLNGDNVVVYVDGDVRITGSVFGYQNTSWGSVSQIPSLYIVASGNVYIDSAVTQIHGSIIAHNGAIFTCSGTGARENLIDDLTNVAERAFIMNDCNTNLLVRGAFSAKMVHLLRTLGTVKDSGVNEPPDTTLQGETFIYGPEIYMGRNDVLQREGGGQRIDSVIALPPAF